MDTGKECCTRIQYTWCIDSNANYFSTQSSTELFKQLWYNEHKVCSELMDSHEEKQKITKKQL